MFQQCIEEEGGELEECKNLVIVNIDKDRLLDNKTPSCGAFYADRGSYLLSKPSCRPRKAMTNNPEIYTMEADPIASYNHKAILKHYTSGCLDEFGKKTPCQLTIPDMSYMRATSPEAYKSLQLWYWALLMSNNITLQLGWGKMSYNADTLAVECMIIFDYI